jgi:hypothetical protein
MQTCKEECLLVYRPFSTYGIKLYLFYHKDNLIANMLDILLLIGFFNQESSGAKIALEYVK